MLKNGLQGREDPELDLFYPERRVWVKVELSGIGEPAGVRRIASSDQLQQGGVGGFCFDEGGLDLIGLVL